jgi:hypothetical protein
MKRKLNLHERLTGYLTDSAEMPTAYVYCDAFLDSKELTLRIVKDGTTREDLLRRFVNKDPEVNRMQPLVALIYGDNRVLTESSYVKRVNELVDEAKAEATGKKGKAGLYKQGKLTDKDIAGKNGRYLVFDDGSAYNKGTVFTHDEYIQSLEDGEKHRLELKAEFKKLGVPCDDL